MTESLKTQRSRPTTHISENLQILTIQDSLSSSKRGAGDLTYHADCIIGNGAFGTVFQTTIAETGEMVAVKKIRQNKRYKNRELRILRKLKHPNIVRMRHAFYTKANSTDPDDVELNLVMDFYHETVDSVIRHYLKMN
jgi:serine/threonine protein kinase